MTKSLDDRNAERQSLMGRLIFEIAVEQAIDVSEGIPPDQRRCISDDAGMAYDDWSVQAIAGGKSLPSNGRACWPSSMNSMS
jgi:hypothetical protein